MGIKLEISGNNQNIKAVCHLCGGALELMPGPTLYIKDTFADVCQACAERQQPTITAELAAARACYAREYRRWMR